MWCDNVKIFLNMNLYLFSYKLGRQKCTDFATIFVFGVCILASYSQEVSNLTYENVTLSNKSVTLQTDAETQITTSASVEPYTSKNSTDSNFKLSTVAPSIIDIKHENTSLTTMRPEHETTNQTTEKINTVPLSTVPDKNGTVIQDFTTPSQSSDTSNATNASTTTIIPAEPVLPDKGSIRRRRT